MVDHLPRPEPLDGETRVAVSVAGVCATDLALAQGYMGFKGVPGHEFVGRALDGPLAGKRVVGEINAACGSCARCLGQDPAGLDARHCQTRSVLGILGRPGAFSEELRLPHGNLLAVPDSVSDEAASFTEPLAAGFALLEALPDVAGQRALVLGDGKLGLLCAMVLAKAGAELDLCGRHPERADWIPGLGAFVSAPEPGTYDVVVEATGHPELVGTAISYARPRGRVVLKTTSSKPVSLDLAPLVVDEIQLIGSRCGRFEPALAALAAGQIDVSPLVHARYPLDHAAEALEHASQRGVLKVLLQVE
ncbi:MAG: threonine dehydrogenase-like Zn-dependent dehydrogenase [Planctomycetota bacterium]